jgi:hypothetical protein
MKRHRHPLRRIATGLVLLTVVGGLALEIHIRGKTDRARASLGGALGEADLPITAGDNIQQWTSSAHHLARCGDTGAVAALLERIANQAPAPSTYRLAALGARAAGDHQRAAHHAEWAARLAPTDKALRAEADEALDVAVMGRVQPAARTASGLGLAFLLCAAATALVGGRRRRRHAEQVIGVRGNLLVSVDGEPPTAHPVLTPDARALTFDAHFQSLPTSLPIGRARHQQRLRIVCSSSTASRSLRLRPFETVRGGAARMTASPASLATLLAHPGTWRAQLLLGERRIALLELRVLSRRPARLHTA